MAGNMPTSRPQGLRTVNITELQNLTQSAGGPAFGDFYYRAMKASWPLFFTGAAAVFLILNSCFALLYALGENPIANARPGSLVDLFFFSVETLATLLTIPNRLVPKSSFIAHCAR
jgi:hypothetical protein